MLEPQAQGVYQWLSLVEVSDGAATVKFGNIQSLAGRVGALCQHVEGRRRRRAHHGLAAPEPVVRSWATRRRRSPRPPASFRSGPISAVHGPS
jgi:hypothetical protein